MADSIECIIYTSGIVQQSGLSRSTIIRLERQGLFPRRHTIGLRKKGLPKSVFVAWLASRAPTDTAQ